MALTPAQQQALRDTVDSRLTVAWNRLQTFQTNYFQANGKYAQFLKTHSVIPSEGDAALPDVGTATPVGTATRYPSNWIDTAMEWQLEIHEYRTPDGQAGYVAFARVTINSRTWERSAQVGPESWRQHGWADVTAVMP